MQRQPPGVGDPGQGDVNSLIRKIKPTNFELNSKQQGSEYLASKQPQRSILKVGRGPSN